MAAVGGGKQQETYEDERKPALTTQPREGHGIKPWSCAKVQFRVLPPAKEERRRGEKLGRLKTVASEGINNTPYVAAKWKDGKSSAALFDTGAQWSLLTETELQKEEREGLQEINGMDGRGVSGEKIPVLGEVWRDVWVGGVLFKNHRFIVVKTMICKVILGIDFWSRAERVAFDFNENEVILNDSRIKLYHHPREVEKERERMGEVFPVTTASNCCIPRRSVALVQCSMRGVEHGREYMVEPISAEDSLVSTPYGIIAGSEEVYLRMANLGDEDVDFEKGQTVAVAQNGEWVRNVETNEGLKDKSGNVKKNIDFSSMVGQTLEPNKKKHLIEILRRYDDIFYHGGKLPIVRVGVEHTIEVKEGSAPAVFKPRRLSREMQVEVREHIDDLFEKGVIRPSNSKWAAPIVCARKSDGSLRMALDYRALNSISHTATLHPIPLIDDLLDRLAKAKYFAVLDAKSGYHQMPLKEEDSEKTAFVVPWGHFEFTERTPFGLKGAGYSFQRMMSTILGASNFVDALCYLDDVLVWGETWEVFIKRLRSVLEKIRSAGLALGAAKCKVGVEEVSYLGCTIKHGMVRISEQRVAQIRRIDRPVNIRGLRSALGAFSYVQRWIPGMAEIAKPLFGALTDKPYARLSWSAEMEEAFETIKTMIADAVALSLPVMDKRFTLVTDASLYAVGAMLSQETDGQLKPIAFYHHTLTKPEQGYSTTERELLAIVLAVKKYRVYLGRGFDLMTDHQALRWLQSLDPENETGRRGRWLDFLQQFDMTIIPKRGKSPEMRIADYLSRVQCSGMEDDGEKVRIAVIASVNEEGQENMLVDKAELLEEQRKCVIVQKVREAIVAGIDINPGGSEASSWRKPSLSGNPKVKELWRMRERLTLDADGMLRLQFNGGKKSTSHPYGVKVRNRIVVPEAYKEKILVLVHRSATAAHMGSKRTWQRARNNFWWPRMRQDVEQYVAECEECGKNKHMNHPNVAPAAKTSIPGGPLEEIMIDFVGPFQHAQTHNFRYLLQVQDVFSRFLIFVPTSDALAKTAVDELMGRWVSLFGVPERLRSDRGPHFIAEVFKELCTRIGIRQKLGSPEHPQSQAQVERQNQLVNQLRCLCDNDAEGWPRAIENVQCSHNASVNATTGYSPARILLGKDFNLPDDLITSEDSEKRRSTTLWEIEDEHQRIVDAARQNIDDVQEKRIEDAEENLQARSDPYKVGDVVRYKLNNDVRSHLGGKIAQRYSEAYTITEVKENGFTYIMEPVDSSSRGRTKSRHFNLLKTVARKERDEVDDASLVNAESREPQEEDIVTTPIVTLNEEMRPDTPQVPPRRSTRQRSNTARLQVDGHRKVYSEVSRDIPGDNEGVSGDDEL